MSMLLLNLCYLFYHYHMDIVDNLEQNRSGGGYPGQYSRLEKGCRA